MTFEELVYEINFAYETYIDYNNPVNRKYSLHNFLNEVMLLSTHKWHINLCHLHWQYRYHIKINPKKKIIEYYKPVYVNILGLMEVLTYKKSTPMPNNYFVKHIDYNIEKNCISCYLHEYAEVIKYQTKIKLKEIL